MTRSNHYRGGRYRYHGPANNNPDGGVGGGGGRFNHDTTKNGFQFQNRHPPYRNSHYDNNPPQWNNDGPHHHRPRPPRHPRGHPGGNIHQGRVPVQGPDGISPNNFHNSNNNRTRNNQRNYERSRHNHTKFVDPRRLTYHDDVNMGGYEGEDELDQLNEPELETNFEGFVGTSGPPRTAGQEAHGESCYGKLDLQQLLTFLTQPVMAGDGEVYLKLRPVNEVLDACHPQRLAEAAISEDDGKRPAGMACCNEGVLSHYKMAIEALRTYLFMTRNFLGPGQGHPPPPPPPPPPPVNNEASDVAPDRNYPDQCPQVVSPEVVIWDVGPDMSATVTAAATTTDSSWTRTREEEAEERARIRELDRKRTQVSNSYRDLYYDI